MLPTWATTVTAKVIAAVLAILLVLFLFTRIESVGIAVGDWFANRRITKLEEKVAEQTAERDAAIRNAEALEAQVQVLEAQRAVAEAAVKAAGQRAQQAAVAASEENARYEKEVADLGAPVSDAERRARIAARLCELFPASCRR